MPPVSILRPGKARTFPQSCFHGLGGAKRRARLPLHFHGFEWSTIQWPDRRILTLLEIETSIIQAPMAGADSVSLALAVCKAGGLGSLACALKNTDEIRAAVSKLREQTVRPFNLNFFCHEMTAPDHAAIERWKAFLAPFYVHWGLDIEAVPESRLRMPFDEEACALVEDLAPTVASFHFGLPAPRHVERLKNRGVRVLSNATSVAEAKWLEERGSDAIIVQGIEAGRHRGMFLDQNAATQTGLIALLPQVAGAVRVPLVAAGGIADARGIAAAFALGASAVQIGTAYLFCPEAEISPLYRKALHEVADNGTALTNLFSGRPARGIVNRYLEEAVSSPPPHFHFLTPRRSSSRSASPPKKRNRPNTCRCGPDRQPVSQSQWEPNNSPAPSPPPPWITGSGSNERPEKAGCRKIAS